MWRRPMYHCSALAPRARHVDPTEEVAGTRRAERVERLPHGHLDVLGRDVVGRRLRVDALEPFDHPVAAGARERQPVALAVELGEREGGRFHGVDDRNPDARTSSPGFRRAAHDDPGDDRQTDVHVVARVVATAPGDATARDRRPDQVVRIDLGARSVDARRPGRIVLRPRRPERQRQVDDPAVGDRARAHRRRLDPRVRPRHRTRPAGGAGVDGRGARSAAAVRATHGARVPDDDGRAARHGARCGRRAQPNNSSRRCN